MIAADSPPHCATLDVPLDVVNNDHVTISTTSTSTPVCPTEPALIDEETCAPSDEETPSETPPSDREPVTEAYYYQRLRESADRFAHQLSTS